MNAISADLTLWRFPASLILALAFLLGIWVLDRYYADKRLCRMLAGTRTAVVLLAATAALTAVEGIWAVGLFHTWPFIALVLLLAASLGLITLRRVRTRPDAGFLLNHAGLFIMLWGSLFGAPDVMQARIVVRQGEAERLAYTASGETVPLPFEVRLERFDVDRYDDGTPRQFRSLLRLDDRPVEASVNSPVRHRGHTLFQDGYDTLHGTYTVLLVVRDPWLWVVWCGVAMLAAGSILLLFGKR